MFSATAWAETARSQVHWGYEGKSGPQYWGELDAQFQFCAAGKNQSPVDLTNFVEAELKPIKFAYKGGSQEILNNGAHGSGELRCRKFDYNGEQGI